MRLGIPCLLVLAGCPGETPADVWLSDATTRPDSVDAHHPRTDSGLGDMVEAEWSAPPPDLGLPDGGMCLILTAPTDGFATRDVGNNGVIRQVNSTGMDVEIGGDVLRYHWSGPSLPFREGESVTIAALNYGWRGFAGYQIASIDRARVAANVQIVSYVVTPTEPQTLLGQLQVTPIFDGCVSAVSRAPCGCYTRPRLGRLYFEYWTGEASLAPGQRGILLDWHLQVQRVFTPSGCTGARCSDDSLGTIEFLAVRGSL